MNRLCDAIFPGEVSGECLDLEATEMSVRSSMHRVGAVLLERLANTDTGKKDSPVDCGSGHVAKFLDNRGKEVTTVLGKVNLRRAYYHCVVCGKGVFPKDIALDIEETGFSPGLQRMMALVGGKESFESGRGDLALLANVVVTAKDIERVSEAMGQDIEIFGERNRQVAMTDNVVPMLPKIRNFYVGMDGTGVPATDRETAGHKGKGENGLAKTREAKLGVIFTQRGLDKNGKPVRDENSTSYTGGIENKEEFAKRIYAEALRRGLSRAERVVILGDGALWIWDIVAEHFPKATMILDYYHATEHLAALSKLIHADNQIKRDLWLDLRKAELLTGDVEMVIEAMKNVISRSKTVKEELRKTIQYFESNRFRMRYAEFQKEGLFIGSGVMEAGCKTIVGQRLKQSGMRWTVRGANAIISLRCCQQSGQWEDYWENRRAA